MDACMNRAREIKAWLAGAEHEQVVGTPLMNCKAIMAGTVCGVKHFGVLAYAPVAYEVALERERRAAVRDAKKAYEAERSQYVGEEGQRIEIEVHTCRLITSWESQYGKTYLYKMVDDDGNVFIWFASSAFGKFTDDYEWVDFKAGKVKATVKEHSERDGIKQTVITRCKACA